MLYLSLVGGVLFVYLFVRWLVAYYRYWTSPILDHIPGPGRKSYWFGWTPECLSKDFGTYQLMWWKEQAEKAGGYSKVPLMSGSFLIGETFVLVLDPDLVHEIVSHPAYREPPRFEKRYARFEEAFGVAMVSAMGSEWHRRRRISQPSFQASIIKEAMETLVPKRTKELLDAWKLRKEKSGTNQGKITIHSRASTAALTLDIFGDAVFSHNFQAMQAIRDWAVSSSTSSIPKIEDPLIQAFDQVSQPKFSTIILSFMKMMWLEKYVNPAVANAIKYANKAVDGVIEQARNYNKQELEQIANKRKGKRAKSLVEVILDTMDKEPQTEGGASPTKLTDEELRTELIMFLMAGHETTSTGLDFMLYMLAKHPDIQERVYQDVCKHSKTDEDINLESVSKMTYLQAFIHEVMRFFPPVPAIMRYNTKDETLAGYSIPANTRLILPMFLLHRHPDLWTKPLEFWPERWLDEKANQTRHKCAYMPFSAGSQKCLGYLLAEMEEQLIMALLVRNVKFTFPEELRDTKFKIKAFPLLKTDPDTLVEVQWR